nr:hypothetical protein [Aeromonas popoffii]
MTRVDDGAWPLTFEYDAAGNLLAEQIHVLEKSLRVL